METVSLSELKGHLSRYLKLAEAEAIVITRHRKPAGVLVGPESDEDSFENRLSNDPRFRERIDEARRSLRDGYGVRLDDVEG